MAHGEAPQAIDFQTHPSRYKHWQLAVTPGDRVATLTMAVDEHGALDGHTELVQNSYDLGVDIELADAIQRLRFEHPHVDALVVNSAIDRVFCAGANIRMLAGSAHFFKVNFCKFTNETRLYLEDASEHSGLKTLAACNGTAAGGGYELALACDRILLVDDRSSAVSLPEVPLLGVLPGTGGLTRVVDKRRVRRDRADWFSTTAEGLKGKRAVKWGLVDRVAPLSRWDDAVVAEAEALADAAEAAAPIVKPDAGVALTPLEATATGDGWAYEHVAVSLDAEGRTATLTLTLPGELGAEDSETIRGQGAAWWPFALFRQFDDAMLRLRFLHADVGTWLIRVVGDSSVALGMDRVLEANASDWFVHEVRGQLRRVLKRLDVSARSLFALAEPGTAFAGTFLEIALAADRIYMLDDPDGGVALTLSPMNFGPFPMGNGLTRLETRFLGDDAHIDALRSQMGEPLETPDADDAGLVTDAPDDLDWDDTVRIAVEERASLSPDALTGMEANLRFAGPETLETKIFGRLSAWQNWIFQRPNAVGEQGALTLYGDPKRPVFNWQRT